MKSDLEEAIVSYEMEKLELEKQIAEKQNRRRWWNAPQYRIPINGLFIFVMGRILTLIYDLIGFDPEYRTLVNWGAILVFGFLIIVREYKYYKERI